MQWWGVPALGRVAGLKGRWGCANEVCHVRGHMPTLLLPDSLPRLPLLSTIALSNHDCIPTSSFVCSLQCILYRFSKHPCNPPPLLLLLQVMQGLPEGGLRRIILTASGGAFRDWPVEKLREVRAGVGWGVADTSHH